MLQRSKAGRYAPLLKYTYAERMQVSRASNEAST